MGEHGKVMGARFATSRFNRRRIRSLNSAARRDGSVDFSGVSFMAFGRQFNRARHREKSGLPPNF